MATTVSDFLTDVRYDLNDHSKQKYDDTYLVAMVNRGIRVLEQELITINSNFPIHTTTGTLSTSANTMELSSAVHSVLRVFISQREKIYLPLEYLYLRQAKVIGTGTGEPYYFSVFGNPTGSGGRTMVFDYAADQDYTITHIYNKLTSTLTTASYLPYDDAFNDYLREGVTVLAQATKNDEMVSVDRVWRELFKNHMYQYDLAINRERKYYNLGF